MQYVTGMPREKIFFVGAGMIMISKTNIEGCPALILTHNKEPSTDKIGTPMSDEDVDPKWFRDNSMVIAFASAEGACNFLERLHDVVLSHGQELGFVDADGNIVEPGK